MTNKKILTNPVNILKNSIKFVENNQLEIASKTLKEGLKSFPKEFSFINLLAQLSLRKKNLDDGINLLKQSLQINPKQPLVMVDLGIALSLNNELDEAVMFFDKSIELDPQNLKAHIRKAITLRKTNRFNESIDCYRKIINLSPDYLDAYINLGELLYFTSQLEESLYFFEKAIKIDTGNPDLYNRCAILFNKLGRVDEAINSYKKSIEISPEESVAYRGLGYIFKALRKFDQSYLYLKKAIHINPNYELYNNIGQLCCQMENNREGIIYFDKAIILSPEKSEAYSLKAYAQIAEREINNAILSFDKAIENDKNYSVSFGERRYWKNNICDWSNFDQELNLLDLNIKDNKYVSVPLGICSFFDSPEIQKLGAELFVNHRFPLNNSLGSINKYTKNKKIKIGYFSGDFRNHPVAYLVTELFEVHDKSKFELFAFSLSDKIESETRKRIEKPFDEFIDVSNYSDKEVALLAREKKIDIAIDLGGHTKNSRPEIFSMRAAPIQINYLGYPGTTGANYIDYNIADKFIVPQELQKYYTEKIIYLPKCYQPNEERITLGKKIFTKKSEGLPENAFIFGCFNNSWKITPNIFKLWIRLLSIVDGSVLWFPGFSKLVMNNLRGECVKLGIDKNRLIFSKTEVLREDYHAKIKLADIFLDCFPYGGQTTASDFLRSGVPIVTLRGLSFSSRVASSLLINLNLSELVTSSEKEYEHLAIKLANNPKYFNEVKRKLISNINSCSIFNTNEYARSLESAYIQAYDRHYNKISTDHIYAS